MRKKRRVGWVKVEDPHSDHVPPQVRAGTGAIAPGSPSEAPPSAGAESPSDRICNVFAAEDLEEVEWGIDVDATTAADHFTGTKEFEESLGKPVDENTVADIIAAVQLSEARSDALPSFFQMKREARRTHSTELADMHQIKDREIEHVRYRAVW